MKNMKKNISLLFLIMVLSLTLVACSGNNKEDKEADKNREQVVEEFKPEATKYPITIKDSYNRDVKLEEEPGRLISVDPGATETIYAINRGAKLVGRTDFDDYPEYVEGVDSIGNPEDPDLEKIIDLAPDLVIVSNKFEQESIEELEEAEINVLVVGGNEDFAGSYELIKSIGIAIDAQNEAKEVIDEMNNTVTEVKEKVKGEKEKSVYYVVGYGKDGDFTAGGDTFIGKMIEMAGGKNVAHDSEGWSYSLDKLVEKDPEILIVSDREGVKEDILKSEGYKDLTAVKEGNVHTINEDILDRNGPRLSEGLLELSNIIHPDASVEE